MKRSQKDVIRAITTVSEYMGISETIIPNLNEFNINSSDVIQSALRILVLHMFANEVGMYVIDDDCVADAVFVIKECTKEITKNGFITFE